MAGIVPGSVWRFEGRNVKDYHGTFNNSSFMTCFREQLLKNLTSNSIIFMDNASYHKCAGEEAPEIKSLKMQELRDLLDSKSVEYPVDAR